MRTVNIHKAAGGHQTASYKHRKSLKFNQNKKRKPAYYRDFLKLENSDWILITRAWNVLNLIRYFGAQTCLLCEDSPEGYDFSFCYQKEVCLLYDNLEIFNSVVDLARIIERNGAKEILLIKIEIKELREANDE